MQRESKEGIGARTIKVIVMAQISDILNLNPLLFDANWTQIDQLIWSLQTVHEQVSAWQAIADYLKPHPVSKGMPFFRLGHMYLVSEPDAKRAIEYLEKAYKEDVKYGPDNGRTPNRMGAYRLLALTKGFIEYLEAKKNWEAEQLMPPHRPVLMKTLLAVYDASLAHILDSEGHTYQSFFAVIQDKSLVRFAIENYFFAERLIEMFYVSGPHLSRHTDEYPLSRAIVGLFGGVLEAILADKLPAARSKALGVLICEAKDANIIQVGTKLAALSSMMLYLRNHVHADRDSARTAYFIDINVAKGCKVAVDWVIADLLNPAP
jgi:hypothetical protein